MPPTGSPGRSARSSRGWTSGRSTRPLRSSSARNATPVPRDLASRVREAALLEGDFVLSSGEKSRFYVDKYLFSTEPALLRDLAHEISGRLPVGTRRLAGVELGSVPLVAAAALESGLSYGIVRQSAKGYGTSNRIEGHPFESGEEVTLIEDVVTTGAQVLAAAATLEEAGAGGVGVLAVPARRGEDF